MKERPVIFTADEVRATLDDRKSQFRRVMKPQPTEPMWYRGAGGQVVGATKNPGVTWCPYGDDGDLLWVRETHWRNIHPGMKIEQVAFERPDQPQNIWLSGQASSDVGDRLPLISEVRSVLDSAFWERRHGVAMPKWAARIWLSVVDVRVGRVQEITAHSMAHHEGVTRDDSYRTNAELVRIFSRAWNSLNLKRGFGWEMNPWVWVVTFERTEAP